MNGTKLIVVEIFCLGGRCRPIFDRDERCLGHINWTGAHQQKVERLIKSKAKNQSNCKFVGMVGTTLSLGQPCLESVVPQSVTDETVPFLTSLLDFPVKTLCFSI